MNIMTFRKPMTALLLLSMLLMLCGVFASADSLSADNSLSSLGITTEGAVVSPDFAYGTTEYNVTVPAGTTTLSLDPVPSNSAAYIDSITGTELTDGTGTVSIVVVAENGDAYTYYLYVTAEASAESEAETEAQTVAPETEAETEAQTEDSRYVSVAKETLEEAENTITTLKSEVSSYRDRVNLLMYILYGMIGLCVILLFVVINLLLKRKDMKVELETYRGLDYSSEQGSYGEEPEQVRQEEKPKKKKRKNKKVQKPVIVEETPRQPAEEDSYAEEYDEFDRTGRDSFYEKEEPAKTRMTDDPATVPKPAKAKKQTRQMPEYEPAKEQTRYRSSGTPTSASTDKNDVDVDFIDL
ncbi:MAG: cadherin-like beta sandwich domain-containing protein [Lachnospiraceae bacterium]|nr:cadherin-like beta sandwich domain-containing protein [Lachnospiraceae bacterium]